MLGEGTIICCEAKSVRKDVLEDQIIRQVRAVLSMPGATPNVVIPMAFKVPPGQTDHSEVHVIEFKAIERVSAPPLEALTVGSDAVFEIYPSVPGLGT